MLRILIIFITFDIFHSQENELNITMPGVLPKNSDAYYCTAKKLDSEKLFLTSFHVHSSMEVAHHILLYGCKIPFVADSYWSCGNICGDQTQKIIYAWARNASEFKYPKDVGYKVGTKYDISYLVLQVHYLNPVKTKDYSYINIKTVDAPPIYEAGMHLMLGFQQIIPPHLPVVHVDIACPYQGPSIHPFAFRTHAHSLGKVISGYVVKENETGFAWTKIGIGSPQWPQAFYPTTQDITINHGDTLAARCTYDSTDSNITVSMGPTHLNEMCNFYMMYYVSSNEISSSPSSQNNYPVSPRLEVSSVSMSPYHIWANDNCEDLTLIPNPMDTVPFDTDPPQLMNFHVTREDTDPNSPSPDPFAGMKQHTSGQMLTVNDSFFADLSFSANTRFVEKEFHRTNPSNNNHHHGDDTDNSFPYSKFNSENPAQTSALNSIWKSQNFDLETPWPVKETSLRLGPTVGLDIQTAVNGTNSFYLYVFHRGPREWDQNSFDMNNRFKNEINPINVSTLLVLDNNGTIVAEAGKDFFFMPHGLTLDIHGNIWVTDVAFHQVFKIAPLAPYSNEKPVFRHLTFLLNLGTRFEPGSDAYHFCKPTGVAVLPTDEFFVADGYCNNRIVMYSADGKFLKQFGQQTTMPPKNLQQNSDLMKIPHSLTLARIKNPSHFDIDYKLLFIADRENGRVVCLELPLNLSNNNESSSSAPNIACPPLIVSSHQRGTIYAVTYVPLNRPPTTPNPIDDNDIQGYLLVLRGKPLNPFASYPPAILIYPIRLTEIFPPKNSFISVAPINVLPLVQKYKREALEEPHDIAAMLRPDNSIIDIYVANSNFQKKKLWKFHLTRDGNKFPASKRPSVKKAGVSMYVSYPRFSLPPNAPFNDEGVTERGREDHDDGQDFNEFFITDKTLPPPDNSIANSNITGTGNSTKTTSWLSTIANRTRQFNTSTLIIVMALGIPITLTCVILVVLRKQSKSPKVMRFSVLNNEDDDDDDDFNDSADFLRKNRKSRGSGKRLNGFYDDEAAAADGGNKRKNVNHRGSGGGGGIAKHPQNIFSRFWRNIYSPLPSSLSNNVNRFTNGKNSNVQFRPLKSGAGGKLHYYYDSEDGTSLSPDPEIDEVEGTTNPNFGFVANQKNNKKNSGRTVDLRSPVPLVGKGRIAATTSNKNFGQFNNNNNNSSYRNDGTPIHKNKGSSSSTKPSSSLQFISNQDMSEEDDVLDLKDYFSSTNGSGSSGRIGGPKNSAEKGFNDNTSNPTTQMKKHLNQNKTPESSMPKNKLTPNTNITQTNFKFGDIANIHNTAFKKGENNNAKDVVNGIVSNSTTTTYQLNGNIQDSQLNGSSKNGQNLMLSDDDEMGSLTEFSDNNPSVTFKKRGATPSRTQRTILVPVENHTNGDLSNTISNINDNITNT